MKFIKTLPFFLFLSGLISILTILAWWIPPSEFMLFQWLGLCMPFITAISVILLFLTGLKRLLNYIVLITGLIGIVYYWPLVFQWSPLSKTTNQNNHFIRVASYNVHNMQAEYGLSSLDRVADFVNEEQIEILCLQEVPSEYNSTILLNAFKLMPYILISEDEVESDSRLVILSKYPLKSPRTLSHMFRPHYALFGDVDYEGKNVKIINCHLQTTNWNQSNNSQNSINVDIISRTSDNFLKREIQTNTIKSMLNKISDPMILAGDFNDSPLSYTYGTLVSGLEDSFLKAGNGYGATYRYLGGVYRIDYIFFDKNYFKASNYRTINVNYSDHLPVLVDLMIINK